MEDVDMVHVTYRGPAPALADLLGGDLQAALPTMPSAIEHVRSGTLRALSVTGEIRSAAFPLIPTIAETVPGYEGDFWVGIGVPRNTPTEIIEKLNREINAGVADPRFKARLADLGAAGFEGS